MKDFLTKVRAGVGHGINVVSATTGQFIDETKIKGRISTLEKERTAALEELGSIVYVSTRNDKPDQTRVDAKVKEIADIDERIAAANREIEEIRAKAQEQIGKTEKPVLGATICGNCSSPVQPGAKFCTNCGAKQ